MNIKKVFLVTIFSCLSLTGIDNVAQAQVQPKSLVYPNKPDVDRISKRDLLSAERSLDRNNCALFYYKRYRRRRRRYRILCAYGNAGKRNDFLKAIKQGRAWYFSGNGKTLNFYIDKVGINRAVVRLQNLGINY